MIEQADLEVAQRAVPNDACFVVSALAGRVIRLLEEDPARDAVEVPAVCERCLLDALPCLVQQATGRTPRIVWTKTWPDASGNPAEAADVPAGTAPTEATAMADAACRTSLTIRTGAPANAPVGTCGMTPDRARIGIVGNALLCFDPFMNDHVVRFIGAQGCEAVLPDPALLYTDDVRYLPQLERFAAQGVHHVICLQSFGCLKGHVHARGALHELARRFPALPITVIDYDPEASALNRENRIRLALAAAQSSVHAATHTSAQGGASD